MNELYHYGVKGMKWGVRKAAKEASKLAKQKYDETYKKGGVSNNIRRRDNRARKQQFRDAFSIKNSIENITYYENRSARQKAKDYQNALNRANRLAARALLKGVTDQELQVKKEQKIEKLMNKPKNARRRAKIKKLIADSKILELDIEKAQSIYAHSKTAVDAILGEMAKDNAVVYRTKKQHLGSVGTKYGELSLSGKRSDSSAYASQYAIYGTSYKVRANTERRQKSKQYADPKKKQEYHDQFVKETIVYW